MTPTELRDHLRRFLGRLSRFDYLAVFAAVALADIEPSEIAARLAPTLSKASKEATDEQGREFHKEAVAMEPRQIAELREELPTFVVDLLLVDLEAFIHGFLADAAGKSDADDAPSLESLLAALWPRRARFDAQQKKSGIGAKGRGEHWSYKDLILLAEVRNAIVHGNGEVLLERTTERLQDAGWTEEELTRSDVLRHRTLNDLLRFKRAVRTLANEVISSLER